MVTYLKSVNLKRERENMGVKGFFMCSFIKIREKERGIRMNSKHSTL